jgi:uncharacterized protein YbbC (DUF1343 family)
MPLQFGIDILLANEPDWKSKNIAFLTNDAAQTNKGEYSRLALMNAGFNIVKLFSPEHGIHTIGADGASINNTVDPITGLPVISLYGSQFMPTEADLLNIDILLFDIPDAGTRFYTYLWTMTYWMEAASKFNKKIVLLDRPNPLGGNLSMTEGPMLDENISSFIGRFNIPVKHQCSLGELARYINEQQNWNAHLTVIPFKGCERNYLFYDWNLKWINPSPALQNIEATILYPGLCFFEATNVSVGRGTPYSFEWIGANWFNISAIKMLWENIFNGELKMETLKLSIPENTSSSNYPNSDNKKNIALPTKNLTETTGIRMKVIDPYSYEAVLNGLLLLKLVRDLHPKDFKWMPYPTQANPSGENHLSLLLGIPKAEALFDAPLQIWLQQITKLLKVSNWNNTIEPYLLYA